jgi:hypothetical protein
MAPSERSREPLIRQHFVYVISSPFGYQKVGWTIDLQTRLRTLSTAHPEPLTLHDAWEVDYGPSIEGRAHVILAPHRRSGEWFLVLPEAAVEAVARAIAQPIKVAWGRPARRLYAEHKEGRRWTVARISILKIRWNEGVSSRRIMDELNAMPGTNLDMAAVSTAAKGYGFRRPEGFANTHDSEIWTVARDAALRDHFPAGLANTELRALIDSLPGKPLKQHHVQSRATQLGLLRPPGFAASVGRMSQARQRDPRWTDERELVLGHMYLIGALPLEIIAALEALPGPCDFTWEIVRDRAKHLGFRRPKGFMTGDMAREMMRQRELQKLNPVLSHK